MYSVFHSFRMKPLLFGTPFSCAVFIFVYCLISLFIWLMYTDNLSNAIVDFEFYSIDNLGDQGKEAHLQMTKRDFVIAEEQYGRYQYNAWLSERIPLKRTLQDYREEECVNVTYSSEKKVTVSIIIAYQLEHPHTLLRTIHSVVEQTSSYEDTEIILIHDGLADRDVFDYISHKLPMVIQLEAETIMGLIQARLIGARIANGDILVFLSAHMEVTTGWLPPLLEPILLHNQTVTEPIMDAISRETFAYQKLTEPEQLAFNWQLEHTFIPLDQISGNNFPKPYATSQLDGRVFAIDRNWFWHLGGWDEGLQDNGGDALELSLKTWQCGGSILTVPCSRVGIIYKRDEIEAQMAPNKNPNLRVRKNFKRVVDVWFDEFKLHFYRYNPRLGNLTAESLDKPRDLRRRLNCKSFGWYRSQIAPLLRNHFLHAGLSNLGVGQIMPFVAPEYCLSIKGRFLIMRKCNSTNFEDWTLTSHCQLKLGQMCLHVDSKNNVNVVGCTKKVPKNLWQYSYQHRSFVSNGNHCLQIDVTKVGLKVNTCDSDLAEQRWMFTGVQDSKLDHAMTACLNTNH
ncbi:putative inactive polypeptide N-acetylgalactosaminyltransferase 11 [Drosophila biarmipes]|uniref:putative inactive polypeptide N-acetylgalactosaminyltransferase 11 n=1 Tax=Drosophila biarmipes TaxID=125945 RepID=UPI0021CCCF70|nr:putative inactive polypeptide N-acetylgalactosaminyltransferase 11 [Drosophila biarmipes]